MCRYWNRTERYVWVGLHNNATSLLSGVNDFFFSVEAHVQDHGCFNYTNENVIGFIHFTVTLTFDCNTHHQQHTYKVQSEVAVTWASLVKHSNNNVSECQTCRRSGFPVNSTRSKHHLPVNLTHSSKSSFPTRQEREENSSFQKDYW